MNARMISAAAVLAVLSGLSPASHAAATRDAAPSNTAQCIRVTDIADSPVIDAKTILIKLRARGAYKRLDLVNPCTDMVFDGFSYATSLDSLCSVDLLHDRRGESCIIKDIVDITPAEAQDLLKHRH